MTTDEIKGFNGQDLMVFELAKKCTTPDTMFKVNIDGLIYTAKTTNTDTGVLIELSKNDKHVLSSLYVESKNEYIDITIKEGF